MANRRRPRLFSFSREIELATVEGWARADQRELLEQVIDAFLDVTRTRQLTAARLAPVVLAASHGSENVRAVGMARLVVLAHYFDHARAAFRDLALHDDPGVRRTAASSLPNAPHDLIAPLAEVYLADEEPEVRRTAARVAAGRVGSGLGTIARHALEDEQDPGVRELLQQAVDAHTDG